VERVYNLVFLTKFGIAKGWHEMVLFVDLGAPVVRAAAAPAISHATSPVTLDLIDKVIKIIAVLIAGAWGYLNYRRGRTFKRRLEPRISGKVFLSHGAWLLCGLAQLKNVGLSKVAIEQRGTAIVIDEKLVAFDPDGKPRVKSEPGVVLQVFSVHGWIEPGEPIEQSFLLALPERANRAAVGLRLRIVSPAPWWRKALARVAGLLKLRIDTRGIEWNDDSIAEIVREDEGTGSAQPPRSLPRNNSITSDIERSKLDLVGPEL
jgi:hypothetical protein